MTTRLTDLRAADIDRAFVAEKLRAALDQGRLSLVEYDERLARVHAARTYGELDRVVVDLPSVVAAGRSGHWPVPVGPATTGPGSPGMPWWAWLLVFGGVALVIVLLLGAALVGLSAPAPV